MKRLIIVGLTALMALPSGADEPKKELSVPARVGGTTQIESKVRDFKNEKYLEDTGLDASTFFAFQQYMLPHTNDTVANRQIILGSSLLAGASAGWSYNHYLKAKQIAAAKLANPAATAVNGKSGKGWGKHSKAKGSTPAPTVAAKAAKVPAGLRRNFIRGAALLATVAGGYEIYNGVMSNKMLTARNKEVQERAKRFIGTPLEEAMRFQIGEEKTDEIIANTMIGQINENNEEEYAPEDLMSVAWVKPLHLVKLGEWAEEGKELIKKMLSEPDSKNFIKDPAVRDSIAEFYGDLYALKKLRIKDLEKEDILSYNRILKNQVDKYLAEIRRDNAQWDDAKAEHVHAEEAAPATPPAAPVDAEKHE